MSNIFIEKSLEPLHNLVASNLYRPLERTAYTPIIYKLDSRGYIDLIEGYRISTSHSYISKKIQEPEDILDLILEGGTCYIASPSSFIPLFIKSLPKALIIMLETSGVKNFPFKDYLLTLSRTSLLVRKGNSFGRVYSFWPAFPSYFLIGSGFDKSNIGSISLEDFTKVFLEVFWSAYNSGISLSTLNSNASILESLILNSKAVNMFKDNLGVGEVHLERAYQCYKGSIFESSSCGTFDGFYYDVVSAYPSVAGTLTPCNTENMKWVDSKEYIDSAFYAFLVCHLTPDPSLKYSPASFRYWTVFGPRLIGLQNSQIVRLTLPEYRLIAGITTGQPLGKVEILQGSWGIPIRYSTPLKNIMDALFELRNERVLGRLLKGASQTISGKLGSKWLEELLVTTISSNGDLEFSSKEITRLGALSQLVYPSHINGANRANLNLLRLKFDALTSRADGIVTPKEIPGEYLSDSLGGLKLKDSGLITIVDDILCETPSTYSGLKERILLNENKESSEYYYEASNPISITQALKSSEKVGDWRDLICRVEIQVAKRTIGSHKRVPVNNATLRNFESREGCTSRLVKSRQEFIDIRTLKRGYNGYC